MNVETLLLTLVDLSEVATRPVILYYSVIALLAILSLGKRYGKRARKTLRILRKHRPPGRRAILRPDGGRFSPEE